MQLNGTTMFAILALLILIFHVYQVYATNRKIWCVFRKAGRIVEQKWAKETQGRIEFDGGWYEVETDRTQLSIKWNPLPMFVRWLDFRHGSARALHPDTFENSFSAEERKQLNLKDDIQAYDQGSRQSLNAQGGRQGAMQKYFPLIVLLGFLIIGYLVWQQGHKIDMLGAGDNSIEALLGEIMKKLP